MPFKIFTLEFLVCLRKLICFIFFRQFFFVLRVAIPWGLAVLLFGLLYDMIPLIGRYEGPVILAGTAVMALTYGLILPKDELDAAGNLTGPATNPDNWLAWPVAMIPVAIIGFFLATRVWNATPKGKAAGGH